MAGIQQEQLESLVTYKDQGIDEFIKTKPIKSKRRLTTKKKLCILLSVSIFVLFIMSIAGAYYLWHTHTINPLRCTLTELFSKPSSDCEEADILESLKHGSILQRLHNNGTDDIERSLLKQANLILCDELTETISEGGQCVKLEKLSQQDLQYIALAEDMWETSWEIVHDQRNWIQVKQGTVNVFTKKYSGIGTVTLLETEIPASPEQVFKFTYNDSDITSWHSGAHNIKVLDAITPNVDIRYMVSGPQAGGIVKSRDYVTLRHWKSQDGVLLACQKSVDYEGNQAQAYAVRGNIKASGMLYSPVKNEPNRCLLRWFMAVHIGGWIPQRMVDQGMADSMQDFLTDLNARIQRGI